MLYLDVGGWYQTTPDERAVLTAFDLRADALPASLPHVLGPWRGVDLERDEAVVVFYGDPDLLLQRRYLRADGTPIWLTVIASRGPKSYRAFEHTPHICYPSSGWTTLQDDVGHVTLSGGGTLPVRRGLFLKEDTRYLVYYWYQWDSPRRDAAEGMASWRLTTDAGEDSAIAEVRLDDLLRLLFDEVVPWNRF